jgi:hypothetical protein
MVEIYPNIYSIKMPVNSNRQECYTAIVKDHKELLDNNYYIKRQSSSFILDYKYDDLVTYLYNYFVNKCKDLFGGLEFSYKNRSIGWAYVSNKNDYRSCIHNHINSATINSVYYLNIPSSESGAIKFYDDNYKVVYTHQPVNDELIIFPSYLLHEPQMSNTEEYRVAINLEITLCNNVWKKEKK